MDTNIELISRAAQAKDILEHPFFIEATAALKEAVMTEWKISGGDPKAAERLFLLHHLTNKFEGIFQSAIENGVVAKHMLDVEEDAKTMNQTNQIRANTGIV